ncbi:MAG TPA: cyanophycin synthetase [Solirubrobacteraceae bacterium]|nr:cyanophycin synthetase [Solirubrobacteraceae bacterium]
MTLRSSGERSAGEPRWSEERAVGALRSLELFGMRFGLDRMRRMMTALDSPERNYATIQVLGTNGKSSTTRMTAAILQRHGLRTGTYTSPHLIAWRERVLIDEVELDADSFAGAVARADHAAEQVNRTLAEDDHVTQFELVTAAALWELSRQEVEVGVIEAGLGGRYDATSVVEAGVTVLTNVGLEHTRWLGPTITDIAEEKLAVVRPGSALVLGAGLAPEALAVAERLAAERAARIVRPDALGADIRLAARGRFQRENMVLARAAAEAHLNAVGRELDDAAVIDAAATTVVPGRLQQVGEDPVTILDGAHNPDAIAALVASLDEVFPDGGPPALVMGVLEDKDAVSMLRMLLPRCARAWFTAPPSARALSPAALQSQARQLGFEETDCEPRPERAIEAARRWAGEHDSGVLATGSVYLVGQLLGGSGESELSASTEARGGSGR